VPKPPQGWQTVDKVLNFVFYFSMFFGIIWCLLGIPFLLMGASFVHHFFWMCIAAFFALLFTLGVLINEASSSWSTRKEVEEAEIRWRLLGELRKWPK
jgi:hypothetical protein